MRLAQQMEVAKARLLEVLRTQLSASSNQPTGEGAPEATIEAWITDAI